MNMVSQVAHWFRDATFFLKWYFANKLWDGMQQKNVLAFWLKIPIHLWLFIAAQWSIFALGIFLVDEREKKNMEKKNNSAFMKKSNTIQLLSHSYQAPNEMTLEDLIEWTNEEKNETKTTERIIIYRRKREEGRKNGQTLPLLIEESLDPFQSDWKSVVLLFFCMHVPCTWPVYFAIILFFLFGLFALIWHCLQFWQARRPLSISKPIYFCCIVIIVTNEWVSWAKVAYTFI